MAATLVLSVFEVILLFFGAIILGVTIHFTIASRKNLKAAMADTNEVNKIRDEWKSRYFNDVELKDRELSTLKDRVSELTNEISHVKEQLAEAEENTQIYTIEAEEMRKENKKLLEEMSQAGSHPATLVSSIPASRPDYLEQLQFAQDSLLAHDEKIRQLVDSIESLKQREESEREIRKANEDLELEISELKLKLAAKETEMLSYRQKEHLSKEMASMLDNAYNEFNVLQGKMQKLELQVSSSKMINMEYEDLKETHHKMVKDCEDQRVRIGSLTTENQQLVSQLSEVEEKLREANFSRQQLQKRVAYLEELNNDLQAVSDANKKLEGQLKRIGELESMLNVVSEERDQLVRRIDSE